MQRSESQGDRMVDFASDKFCDDCYWYKPVYNGFRCCHYLLMTGKKRPCPPGKDCTVKVTVKVKRRRKRRGDNGKDSFEGS